MKMQLKLPPRVGGARTRPRKQRPTFSQYIARYLAAHDVCEEYAKLLQCRAKVFAEWIGSDIPIAKLDCDLVNEWLASLQQTALRPNTISGYKRSLHCVWMFAYQNGDNNNPPLRLRKIREPILIVEAFTHVEIRKLIDAAKTLRGFYPNGIRRADFWPAAILSAYSTGLRRGDLLKLRITSIDEHGIAHVVQTKTGFPAIVQFLDEARECIHKIAFADGRVCLGPILQQCSQGTFEDSPSWRKSDPAVSSGCGVWREAMRTQYRATAHGSWGMPTSAFSASTMRINRSVGKTRYRHQRLHNHHPAGARGRHFQRGSQWPRK